MRQNIRMNSADELLLAQVKRAQELRCRDVMPEDADIEIMAYLAVFCIVLMLILTVIALA